MFNRACALWRCGLSAVRCRDAPTLSTCPSRPAARGRRRRRPTEVSQLELYYFYPCTPRNA
eukprot:scaffold7155_cov63-Phaeocystis_antarctica.AAC.4